MSPQERDKQAEKQKEEQREAEEEEEEEKETDTEQGKSKCKYTGGFIHCRGVNDIRRMEGILQDRGREHPRDWEYLSSIVLLIV